MKITETASNIRQQQPGQFSRPEDGKAPFAHVNDQKLVTIKEQQAYSVYVSNEKLVALDRVIESDFPKLFDFDTGIKYNIENTNDTKEEEKFKPQYDKTGKTEIIVKQEGFVDQLA